MKTPPLDANNSYLSSSSEAVTGRKKRTVSASVVAQSREKNASNSVTSLRQTRLEHGRFDDGRSFLHAVFPNHSQGAPACIDLSFLLNFPNLQELFGEAFLIWGSPLSNRVRIEVASNLRRYFFSFLASVACQNVTPNEIDDQLFAAFKAFLSRPRRNGQPLNPNTIGDALGAIRRVLAALDTGPLGILATSLAERVPSGPVGAALKSDPVNVISLPNLMKIVAAAEDEVHALKTRWENGRRLIEEGHRNLAAGNRNYEDLATCLAAIDVAFPGVIPTLPEIDAHDKALRRAVQHVHTSTAVASYFYPTGRDLVAFVLLLGVATVFNPDTLLSLTWRNVENVDRLGKPAVKIVGVKGRASVDMVRLLDANISKPNEIGISLLLELLHSITERIRPCVEYASHTDKLFIYVQQFTTKFPKSFGTDKQSPSTDIVWTRSLNNFCRDNKLQKFTLGQLRPTLIDLTLFLNGDLAAAQAIGNHRQPHTTWTFYTSSGVKKRFLERLGEVLILRQRWVETAGVVDPRRLMQSQDRGAATPGFICLDPFDSPRKNQRRGRPCKAYGECPSCELAAADIGDPSTVALYFSLKDSIYQSQANMSSQTWLLRWAPVLADLDGLLKMIPKTMCELSRQFRFILPLVE